MLLTRSGLTAKQTKQAIILYVYLFKRDSYFSGIGAESSALIHEYANIFDKNEM